MHGLANAVIMPYVLEAYGSCVYKNFTNSASKQGYAVKIQL